MTTALTNVLTPAAAADHLGVTEDTLKRWRRNRTGPTYCRIGYNLVRYRVADLDAWIDAHATTPSPADTAE